MLVGFRTAAASAGAGGNQQLDFLLYSLGCCCCLLLLPFPFHFFFLDIYFTIFIIKIVERKEGKESKKGVGSDEGGGGSRDQKAVTGSVTPSIPSCTHTQQKPFT